MKAINNLTLLVTVFLIAFSSISFSVASTSSGGGNVDSGDSIPNEYLNSGNDNSPAGTGSWTGNPDSGDGIPNDYDGLHKGGSGFVTGFGGNNDDFIQKKNEVRERLQYRHVNTVDGLMNKFYNKYREMPQEKIREKYDSLIGKIDAALIRLENTSYSERKKEAHRNIYMYIRLQAEEKYFNLDDE